MKPTKTAPPPTLPEDLPTELRPRILFEDTHLIVVDKPAGLLSQGEHTGDFNLVDWCRHHFGRNYVGLVHRLDRNTSGLLIIAKRSKAAQRLTHSLQEGSLKRSYLAWVAGGLTQRLELTDFLLKNEATNESRVVREGTPRAKRAHLSATPLGRGQWQETPLSLVEIELDTGRSHQIRVQMAHANHPLLGDSKYAKTPALKSFPRLALHSHHLQVPHPMGGNLIDIKCPLPADLAQLCFV